MTYEQASRIVRDNKCTSRKSFWDWHAASRPNNIPKMPDRVYAEWTTWGEFLGNTNVFSKHEKGNFRPYWEAVRWAQGVCIENDLTRSIDWLHYYDANEGEIPSDIPRNAQYHYSDDWLGWPTWLGKDVKSRIVSAKQEVGVFALCTHPWTPNNVLRVLVANDGMGQLKEMLGYQELKVVKVYKFDPDVVEQLNDIINSFGKYQLDGSFIVHDVNGLLYEYDNLLELAVM